MLYDYMHDYIHPPVSPDGAQNSCLANLFDVQHKKHRETKFGSLKLKS